MQNNTQSRDTGQPSDYVPVQVQVNDMNVASAPQSQSNNVPILASSNGNNTNNYQTLQQQQLQILAACNAATAFASHQHQTQDIRNGTLPNPASLVSIAPNSSTSNGAIPPAFMMNFLIAASAMGYTSGLGTGMSPPFPLTTSGLAAAPVSAHKPKSVLHTPEVFQNCSLRSGKWIEEEEKYAKLLIELFEKGNVPRCENGTTLRSFLSQKLHCVPMRVSKKYAGLGIGKLVYNDGSKVSMTPDAQAELKSLVAKVAEAQEKFHKAALPSQNTSVPSISSFGSFPAPLGIPGLLPPLTRSQNQASASHFTAIQPSLSTSSRTGSFIPHQGRSDVTKNVPIAALSKDQKVVSNEEAAKALLEESAKLLHQSFLAANGTDVNVDGKIQSNPVPSNQQMSTSMSESQTLFKPEGKFNYHAKLPDLVSFDQGKRNDIALAHQKQEAISQQQQSNSPARSSGPFDGFRLFPGSEFSTGGSCVSNMSAFSPSADSVKRSAKSDTSKPTSNPLFTAESYAMFAVESAMAASQHDAYLPCSRVHAGPTNNIDLLHQHVLRSNSIDKIDGVVNLLVEQSDGKVRPTENEKDERREVRCYDSLTMENVKRGVVSYGGTTIENISPSCQDFGYSSTYQSLNIKPAYVSASERSCNPSTETESSSALESSRDSTNSENTEASASDSGSSSESFDSGCRARRKRQHTVSESESMLHSDEKRFRNGNVKDTEDSSSPLSTEQID